MNENNANELKPFNQLNQDEKIDRLVGEVKRLINLTDYLTERLNKQSIELDLLVSVCSDLSNLNAIYKNKTGTK